MIPKHLRKLFPGQPQKPHHSKFMTPCVVCGHWTRGEVGKRGGRCVPCHKKGLPVPAPTPPPEPETWAVSSRLYKGSSLDSQKAGLVGESWQLRRFTQRHGNCKVNVKETTGSAIVQAFKSHSPYKAMQKARDLGLSEKQSLMVGLLVKHRQDRKTTSDDEYREMVVSSAKKPLSKLRMKLNVSYRKALDRLMAFLYKPFLWITRLKAMVDAWEHYSQAHRQEISNAKATQMEWSLGDYNALAILHDLGLPPAGVGS